MQKQQESKKEVNVAYASSLLQLEKENKLLKEMKESAQAEAKRAKEEATSVSETQEKLTISFHFPYTISPCTLLLSSHPSSFLLPYYLL